ncbi:MAG: chorismate-binding protein, partial [Polyangiaceae bacterium]
MVATLTFVADTMTPVRAYAALRRAAGDAASFLLESVIGGERWGRYSILGYEPKDELTLLPGGAWVGADGRPRGVPAAIDQGDPLEAARAMFGGAAGVATSSSHPAARFAQSYVGYLGWDLVHATERVPGWGSRVTAPLARFFGGATIVVFDSLSHTVTIAAEDPADVERARGHLERMDPMAALALPNRTRVPGDVHVEVDDARFMAMARRAQEYIAAGDAFQVVLARQFTVPRAGRDPFDVYRAMRVINPSPYMYFLDLPPGPGEATRTQIAGASPETLVRLEGGIMTVRPLA